MAKTARLRCRPGAASVIALVTLVAALAGTALAGEPATSSAKLTKSKVKKIAQKQIDKLPLVGAGAQASSAMAGDGSFRTVLSSQIPVLGGTNQGALLVDGAVEALNTAPAATATVDLRVLVDGMQEGGTFSMDLPATAVGSAPVSIGCNTIEPGTHTVELQAQGPSAVSFMDRSLNAAVIPVGVH